MQAEDWSAAAERLDRPLRDRRLAPHAHYLRARAMMALGDFEGASLEAGVLAKDIRRKHLPPSVQSADLLHPIRNISLSRETSEIDYRSYHFLSSPTTFLLPNCVTVSVEWGRKRLRNEHTFSKFQLCKVDVHEEGAIGVPTLNADRQAFRVNPNNDNVHVNLGLALDNKGDLEAAIGEYREGLRLNPNNDLMSSTGDLFEAGNSNPLPTSFCERLGIYAHTSPSRPKISSLGEPIYCPGLQVRMLPAVCIPPGAGASLSYTRSTSAACNPFGPVFTSKLTLAPSSNDRYPLPIIAEKWTNTSSPLSRWMNP